MAGKQVKGTVLGGVITAAGIYAYIVHNHIAGKFTQSGYDVFRPDAVRFLGGTTLIFGLAILAITYANWLRRE